MSDYIAENLKLAFEEGRSLYLDDTVAHSEACKTEPNESPEEESLTSVSHGPMTGEQFESDSDNIPVISDSILTSKLSKQRKVPEKF